jgi:hypothetical protein
MGTPIAMMDRVRDVIRQNHPHADADRRVRSSVDVPLDIDGLAGEPEVGVGLAQGLHQRRLQRQASRLCDDAR